MNDKEEAVMRRGFLEYTSILSPVKFPLLLLPKALQVLRHLA